MTARLSAFFSFLLALWVVIGAPPRGGSGSGLSTGGGTITGASGDSPAFHFSFPVE